MSLSSTIKVVVAGDVKGAQKALRDVQSDAQNTGNRLAQFGKVAALGFAGAAAAAVAFATSAVKSGDQLNEAQDQLRLAIENTGGSYAKQKAAIDAADKAGEKYGYTSKQTDDALASLTRSTGSSSEALKLLGTAQNLAAATGKPLADVTTAVAKASEGQLRPLKQLGIDLPVAAGGALKVATANANLVKATAAVQDVEEKIRDGRLKGQAATDALAAAENHLTDAQGKLKDAQSSGGQILAALNQRLKGAADVGAQSLAGKTKALRAQFEDLKAHIGQQLIPILTKLASWFTNTVIPAIGKLVAWVQANWPKLVAAVTPTIDNIRNYIIGFVSTVEHLWDQFGGRIVSLAKKYFKGTETEISGVLSVVKGLFRFFADFLTGKWGKLWSDIATIFTGLWKIVKGGIQIAWGEITTIISLAWDGIKNGSRDAIGKIIDFVTGIPGKLLGLVSDFYNAAKSLGSNVLHGIMDGVGGAIDAVGGFLSGLASGIKNVINSVIIDPLRNFHFKIDAGPFHHTFQPFGSLPRLHSGGIFQAGGGEGLALLQSGEGVFTQAQMRALGGIGGHVVNNFPAGSSPAAVHAAQARWNRRNGRSA